MPCAGGREGGCEEGSYETGKELGIYTQNTKYIRSRVMYFDCYYVFRFDKAKSQASPLNLIKLGI